MASDTIPASKESKDAEKNAESIAEKVGALSVNPEENLTPLANSDANVESPKAAEFAADKEEVKLDTIETASPDKEQLPDESNAKVEGGCGGEEHDLQQSAKSSGYLEKKGKLRMVSSWKKYWFVLEGRLLLYYRSRAEYDTLSPCKGSITLGSPCNIKPGPASSCMFQIETRNNTITLRAENRGEQDKWMLAILGALNQCASGVNQTKLSHFRYSADDLNVRTPTDKPAKPALLRQNTLPERLKEITSESATGAMDEEVVASPPEPPVKMTSIIERLQSIGGQSYTAHVIANPYVGTSAPNRGKKPPPANNISKPDLSAEKDNWVVEAHEEGVTRENDLYGTHPPSQPEQKEKLLIQNKAVEMLVENVVYATTESLSPALKFAEGDKHIYQEITAEVRDDGEVIVENSEYVQVDFNENKVDKPQYSELAYGSNASLYCTIPNEPTLPPRPSVSPVSETSEKSDKKIKDPEKTNRLKKLAKLVREDRKDAGGKRPSFVVRMFQKIKRNDTSKDEEKLIKKETDGKPEVAVEVFAELKEFLKEKQSTDESQTEKLASEEQAETVDEQQGKLKETIAEDWIQEDLSLLNEIPVDGQGAEAGADAVPATNDANTETTHDKKEENVPLPELEPAPQLPIKQKYLNKHPTDAKCFTEFDYDIYDPSQRINIPRPKLIPKAQRPKRLTNTTLPSSKERLLNARYHQQQQLQLQEMTEYAGDAQNERLMTIDEILDDLENQHYEPFSRQKVKELIEKFNDTEHESDADTKENHGHVKARHHQAGSDEAEDLKDLLDELSKVTNAPVISPKGGSESLSVNRGYADDDEWKHLSPVLRKRRHSDPDYDIPRPHSALQIIPSSEQEEAKMQPTRFFGPVIMEQTNGDSTSCGTSITPDSLEVDILSFQTKNYTPSIEEDRSMRSYTSHIYSSNESHQNTNFSHASHTNQPKAGDGNKSPAGKPASGEIYARSKQPLSSLIVPKTECEHAFYLNENNNNNITRNLNLTAAKDTAEKRSGDDERGNSLCFDSLEPYMGDTA